MLVLLHRLRLVLPLSFLWQSVTILLFLWSLFIASCISSRWECADIVNWFFSPSWILYMSKASFIQGNACAINSFFTLLGIFLNEF